VLLVHKTIGKQAWRNRIKRGIWPSTIEKYSSKGERYEDFMTKREQMAPNAGTDRGDSGADVGALGRQKEIELEKST